MMRTILLTGCPAMLLEEMMMRKRTVIFLVLPLLVLMLWAASRDENSLLHPGGFGGIRIRDPFSLEDFGLTYPLTVADLVDNWEKLNDLWFNGLADTERDFIPGSSWGPIEVE
jgi:hypothetical protein